MGALLTALGIGSMGLSMGLTIKDLLDSGSDEPAKSSVVKSKGGGNGSAGEAEDGAYGGQMTHLGAEPSQGSLGRPIALEDDPVLNQPVDNYNNFIF